MSRKPGEIPSSEVAQLMEKCVGRIAVGKITVREAEFSVHPIDDTANVEESVERSAGRVSFVSLESEEKAGTLVSFRSSQKTIEDGTECITHVLASFEVQYAVKPELFREAESLEAFARINGVFLAWSYWREFFMNACCRMGVTADMIPLLPAKDAQKIAGYIFDEPKE